MSQSSSQNDSDSALDDVGNFYKPVFTVARRLHSIARSLGNAAPQWGPAVNPQSSMAISTSNTLQHPTLHPAPSTPPDQQTRNYILNSIQINPSQSISSISASCPALNSNRSLLFFKRNLKNDSIQDVSDPDSGSEAPYTVLLRGILQTILPLVAFLILQLWIDEGAVPPSWEQLLSILLSLKCDEEQTITLSTGRRIRPDFSIRGIVTPVPNFFSDPLANFPKQSIATLDSKNSSNARKVYEQEGLSKDDYISLLTSAGEPFSTTWPRNSPNSWQSKTHHLLAQMHNQAFQSLSHLSLFTSLYGFMRIVAAQEDTLNISDNLSRGWDQDDSHRRDIQVNSSIVQEIFFFVFDAVVRAYSPDQVLPPHFRQIYRSTTYTESLPPLPTPFSVSQFFTGLIPSIGLWGSKIKAWTCIFALRLFGPSLLKYVASFAVPSLAGFFSRPDKSGFFSIPAIPFAFLGDRDGRWVGLNKDLNLVIKIFLEEDAFSQEYQVYTLLSQNSCPYVPKFYGSFHNQSLSSWAILISYEGSEVEGFLTQTDRIHLRAAVTALHVNGVHHHDLKLENLVRGRDGILKVIDFHLSQILDETSCPENTCPDWQWIREIDRS